MICFFNTTKAWGGGEKWHFDIASAMAEAGDHVVVVTHPESQLRKKLSNTGIKTVAFRISNLSFLNPVRLLSLVRFFKKNKVNCIVMNLPADLKVAGIAALVAGVRRIIYRRGSAIPIRNTLLNRFLLGDVVTDVLANSHETKRTILVNNPNLIAAGKITVIHNGIKITPDVARSTIKKQESDPVVLGSLGRLEKQKAQHLLVDLAVKLKAAGHNFRIIIGGEGRLRGELEKRIAEQDLDKFVKLFGYVDDVEAFMREIDIFVLPSHWEGFGYVLAEAMAFCKPVVAFNHSSNPELVDDNQTGYLAKPGDMDDFFAKCTALITDSKRREKFGLAGRDTVLREFSFEKNFQRVRDFLLKAEID